MKIKQEKESFFSKTTVTIEHRDTSNKTTEKITLETYDETLPDLLRCFEQALRGAGFIFEGTLQIIDEKEI